MIKITRTACLLALMLAVTAHGQTPDETPFSIKEFAVGMPMESCPGPSQAGTGTLAGSVLCRIPADLLGGTPINAIFVALWQGRVLSVGAFLQKRGRYAAPELVEALTEKYGRPDSSKAHLNEYRWRRNGQDLSFDGYDGTVIATDRAAVDELRRINAKKNSANL